MYTTNQLVEIIDKGIKNLAVPEEPSRLYEPIKYTVSSGGKRIRPVLVLAATNLFSDSIDKALSPALAIELFHNFTLIHDDIMDDAPLRRNQPTVYSKWGSNVAILSGDALNILAYQLLSKTDNEHLAKVLNIFNSIALGVCDGQQLDMDYESAQYVTEEEYIGMIEQKTSILLKGALQIGGVIGRASNADVINLGEFGRNLGLAFQLQDDLLDAFGDEKSFGKMIGGDILANKKTFLTIKAFSLAKGNSLEMLSGYFKAQNIEPDKKINGVLNIYNELGVKEITESKIEEFYQNALNAMEKVNVLPDKKETLIEIAQGIMKRER